MSKPIAPYSPFRESQDLVFFAGQIGQTDGTLVEGGIEAELKQVFVNISDLLNQTGLKPNDIIKATVLLADIDNYAIMNDIYGAFFADQKPARSAYAIDALPRGAAVEIELIGKRNKD